MIDKKETSLQKKDEEKTNLLRASKISLILEEYNDIFSDFDPRHYSERALSDDFLQEAKKAVRSRFTETDHSFELAFLIPNKVRNLNDESIIKKRLREHFKKHYIIINSEVKSFKKKGISLAIVGALLGIIATFVAMTTIYPLLKNVLLILLEPASWFTIWTGFEYIFFVPETKKHELEFYKKMSEADITFQEY